MKTAITIKKILLTGFLFLLTGALLCADDFYLIKYSATAYFDAPEKYRNTLNKFNMEIRKAAGVSLPINPKNKKDLNRIKIEFRKDNQLHTEDEFSYSFPDEKTMVVNCTPISLQWFLNHILEKYAGVHYLFNDALGRTYHKNRIVKLPRKAYSEKPSFNLGRYTYLSTPVSRPWFNMKKGANTNHALHIFCFPAKKYAKDNSYPAAMRPLINGKRMEKIPKGAMYWQPCYSNPETARIAVENIFEYLKEHPDTQSISLTVNDCGNYCQCDECKKANKGGDAYHHSEVYFTWVKRVAEAVGKKYPDLPLVALAYNMVYNPCSFKLPDNVVIALCLDIYSVTDPKMMEHHKRIIADWGSKAKKLGVWDYSWGYPYLPPRMYLKRHVEMLRYLYQHGARHYFGECEGFNSKEGPKIWLIHKLLWNIDQDEKALLDFWYKEVAGEKAAPHLRKFFEFWEDYFQSDAIRKTPWFRSSNATYMTAGDKTYIYGLQKGDIAKANAHLEKALEIAETPEQKARIRKIERTYRQSEALLHLYAAEYIPPEGELQNAKQAVELLQAIPSLLQYQEIKRTLSKELENDPWASIYYKKSFRPLVAIDDDGTYAMVSHIVMASRFLDDPAVAAEMKKLANDPKLAACVSKVAQIFLKIGNNKNLFTNGDIESELTGDYLEIHRAHRRNGSGIRSTKYASSGKYSYQIKPGGYTLLSLNEKAKPDTYYLAVIKVYQETTFPDSYLTFAMYPALNKRNQDYNNPVHQKFPAGKWQTFVTFCKTRKNSNGLRGAIVLKMYPENAKVFIDDIQLYEIK